MASVLSLTSRSTPTLGGGGGTVSLSLASVVSGLASISDTTAAGTLTAVTDGDYLLGLNAAGTYVRKVLKSSIITTDASLLTSGTLDDARLSANVPLKNAANVFTAGQQINSAATGSVPLTLKGYSGQTANLTEWQDSAGSVGARVTASREFSNSKGYPYSEKFGEGATAISYSSAFGYYAYAGGPNSSAAGLMANASNNGSLAVGAYSTASGYRAFAIGYNATAAADFSCVINGGDASTASLATSGSLAWCGSGYDPSLVLARWSSTLDVRRVGGVFASWADSTDTTRTGQLSLGAYYTGTLQEGLRITAGSGGVSTTLVDLTVKNNAGNVMFKANDAYGVRIGPTCNLTDDMAAYYYLYTTPVCIKVAADRMYGWSNASGNAAQSADTALGRNAAGVVEVNNGTAGTYRDLRLRNVRTEATTVAGLVAAATAGAGSRAFVTDATATTFASAVTGGGANAVPVYSDGAAWYIG